MDAPDRPEVASAWRPWESEERSWLARWLSRRLPPDAVDDVLQDTWLACWRLGDRYEEAGRRRALLQRIASRRAADWHRAHAAEPVAAREAVVDPDPDRTGDLLRTVGVDSGSLLWRRVIDDWSLPMLAAHFGVPVGTIKSRLNTEKWALARRLADWRQSLAGPDEPCSHVRADVLGVRACPRCTADRAVWHGLIARAHPDAGSQTTYFTVDADGGLWLDAILNLREPVPGGEPRWGNSLAIMGPFRRLQNAYGHDLSSRVRTVRESGQEFLLFPMRREDGHRFLMTQHGTAAQAEAATTIRPSRRQVDIHCDIGFAPGTDGTTFLELPRTLALTRVEPVPTHVASPHDRLVLVWAHAADLAHYPQVVARFV